MILIENDLQFDFTDAIDAIKFDNSEHGLSHCMKAVDFIVELPHDYLYIEVKDPSNPHATLSSKNKFEYSASPGSGSLKRTLVSKFRDSFLYRWSELKQEKQIRYLSLITLDDPLCKQIQDDLQNDLPYSP